MTRRAAASLALLVLVVSAGCLGFGAQPERTARAEAELAAAQAAVEDVETYQYETQMDLSASVEDERRQLAVRIEGTVDVAERMARSRAHLDGANRTAYVTNRTAYRECESPWGWGNESIAVEGSWIQATPLGRQLQLLESGGLHVEAEDSLAQADAVVLVGQPSAASLEKYGVSATQPAIGGPSVENVSVRVVIDNSTHRPIRSTVAFAVAGGGGAGQGTVDTQFSAYDEPVSIAIPDVVKDEAGETGCPGS
jgi:hypothetical protein